jgi:hypothetical protein
MPPPSSYFKDVPGSRKLGSGASESQEPLQIEALPPGATMFTGSGHASGQNSVNQSSSTRDAAKECVLPVACNFAR